MTKVVYNGCYGGFGLSDEAVRMYLQLKEVPFTEEGSKFSFMGKNFYVNGEYFSDRDIPRTDPDLIRVVEALDDEANGRCANLQIEDVEPGTLYRISEYDGYESVMTLDDYIWERA